MSKGKIASQVAHAACKVFANTPRDRVFRKWKADGAPKIVVKAKEAILNQIQSMYPLITYPIFDAGITEISPNTLTVLGVRILSRKDIPRQIRELKLL